MKRSTQEKKSRRKFLSLGFLGGAGLLAGKKAEKIIPANEEESVSMLTPDGKLVEVKKSLLVQNSERQKAGNQDILNWTKTQTQQKS